MKKILLATTALFAVTAVPAHAELQVTLGGYVSFEAAAFDDDFTPSQRDFQSESEVTLHADGAADNGLLYGAVIKLNTSTSDTLASRNTYIYLSGNWGRVEMGDNDGASELVVYAPTVGIGQIDGSYGDYVSTRLNFQSDRGDHTFTALDTATSTKITYYTPKFSGFQAGISYAPQALDTKNNTINGETVSFNNIVMSDAVELGLSYDHQFGAVALKVGGNYIFANNNIANEEDLNAFSFGAQVGYKGFRVGGGYTYDGDSLNTVGLTDDKADYYNAGVTYEQGPWGVGVSYLLAHYGDNGFQGSLTPTNSAGGDASAYVAGGTYTIAPGLTAGVDVAYFHRNEFVGIDNSGYSVVTAVTAAF